MTIVKVKVQGINLVGLDIDNVVLLPSFTKAAALTIALDPKNGKSAYALALIDAIERITKLNLLRVYATWFLNSLSFDGLIPERVTRTQTTKKEIVDNLLACTNEGILQTNRHFMTEEGLKDWSIKILENAPVEFYGK